MDVRKDERNVTFTLGGMVFEYDEEKNQINIKKHGIPFTAAARVFLTMIVLNYLTMHTVKMKIVTTRSGTQVLVMWDT